MMKAKSGFTLVEILIVVVILGILAAIVIPQFTEASTEAKLSSLCTDLQTIRSQIELFKVQHNDVAPLLATFVAQMTTYSDIDGNTNAAKTPVFCYGPYLQKIPVNQFNDVKDPSGIHGKLDASGTIGDDGGSWEYNETTGVIHADDSYDKDAVPGVPDHANL
jgi:general secretion pathway protein G